VLAVRSPAIRQGDADGLALRARAAEDRASFKRLLKDIVVGLKNMCIAQADGPEFQLFASAPKVAIQNWCGEQEKVVDAININEELINQDGVAVVFNQPPENLYN
jgi:hypothetical protein